MSPTPDTLRTFGPRFAMTGDVIATPLYDEHQARDVEHDIDVGLWVPRPQLFASLVAQRRLASAITQVRAIADPRVRRVFAAGTEPGAWISLQPARPFVVGPVIARDHLAAWIDALAGALGALHAAGLVHGGVLEHDVVALDGQPRLAGGGIWNCAEPFALASAAGSGLLAPERRAGAPATASGDAWALAAVVARWVGGAGPDPFVVVHRRHPGLAAALAPALAETPERRRTDLRELAGAARAALATPFADEIATPAGRGRRRKKRTTEEKTAVGHASGVHVDDEPTDRAQPPAPPATPRKVADVASAPILAVSMKPGGPGDRLAQPTPPAPTPNLPRPNLRASTRDDPSQPLGRLAPPRAVVEAQRRRARAPWIFALLGVVVVAAIVLGVLLSR
jgi:hypothetical protein